MEIKNFVGIFDNAFSNNYCQRVIDYFDIMYDSGCTITRKNEENILRTAKDDTILFATDEPVISLQATRDLTTEFNRVFWNECYSQYADKFDILKNIATHKNYHIKIQKTEPSQGYHLWHFESEDRTTTQRILAWMLYLNDVEEGGETEFLYYPMRIKPKQGTLLIWPTGFTHTHRGNPPISNTKYILTGWIEF